MSRPRSFDDDAVRDRITDLFTANGYRGTSLAMVSEAAGLGRQSLYNAFGDKQALYLQSLERTARRLHPARQAMAAADNGRHAIELFFDHVIGACAHADPAVNSCIVSSGLLDAVDDKAVAASLRATWRATRALLRSAVERGRRDGTVRQDVAAAELARLLMLLVSGLRVSGRVDSPAQLRASIRLALHAVCPFPDSVAPAVTSPPSSARET
jgi:TetR/AcrR family transcriptional repressor of nem operon